MNRKTIIITSALAIAFAVTTNLRAAPAPNTTSTEGVTVETGGVASEAVKETPAQRDARMKWWRDAKFGLFIHWGVYAVPAGKYGANTNYGEWIMQSARIPVAEYRELRAAVQSGEIRSGAVGEDRQGRRDALHRHHVEASRWIRAVSV
jgi:hypothetical protein